MTERISPERRAAIVERVIAEIRDDVLHGVLPYLPDSFSELHDFVDANTYGGMCDETANADVCTEDWIDIQEAVQDWLIAQAMKRFDEWWAAGPNPPASRRAHRMSTIARNRAARIAEIKQAATRCTRFTLENQFIGDEVDPGHAWRALEDDHAARLVEVEPGHWKITIHENRWYELRAAPADTPADNPGSSAGQRPRDLTVDALIRALVELRDQGLGGRKVTVDGGRAVRTVTPGERVALVQAPDLYMRNLDNAVMRDGQVVGWIYPEDDRFVVLTMTNERLGDADTIPAAVALFDR